MELAQLFQDLDAIVVQQEPMIQQVEKHADDTRVHMEEANVHLDGANKSARAARKKKWICLGIVIAIIAIIVIVVLVWMKSQGMCKLQFLDPFLQDDADTLQWVVVAAQPRAVEGRVCEQRWCVFYFILMNPTKLDLGGFRGSQGARRYVSEFYFSVFL